MVYFTYHDLGFVVFKTKEAAKQFAGNDRVCQIGWGEIFHPGASLSDEGVVFTQKDRGFLALNSIWANEAK